MLTIEQQFRQFCRLLLADRLFGDELTAFFERERAVDEPAKGSISERRVALFRRFLADWNRHYFAPEPPAPFTTAAMMYSAGPPPSAEKTALLLNDVLQFSKSEIGEILAPNDQSVTELIVIGRAQHANKAHGAVVIVEDEALIASDLVQILESIGVKIAGVAHDGEKALELINAHRPDLILADYNLEDDRTGVDVVEESRAFHDCPVMFVTGFPDQALQGSEREPDVVIGKPYTIESIKAAAAHCLSQERAELVDVGE